MLVQSHGCCISFQLSIRDLFTISVWSYFTVLWLNSSNVLPFNKNQWKVTVMIMRKFGTNPTKFHVDSSRKWRKTVVPIRPRQPSQHSAIPHIAHRDDCVDHRVYVSTQTNKNCNLAPYPVKTMQLARSRSTECEWGVQQNGDNPRINCLIEGREACFTRDIEHKLLHYPGLSKYSVDADI